MSQIALLDALKALSERKASDLFLTYGAPPTLGTDDGLERLTDIPLDDHDLSRIVNDITDRDQQGEFTRNQELNTSLDLGQWGRFRINIFRQRQHNALVIRRITAKVPTLQSLGLPTIFEELSMEKRGFLAMVGGTGSGKSTSLAAILDHRNTHGSGHIITFEDPLEYVHEHKGCLVSQREIGTDTRSYHDALKNSLRQKPEVILAGEIRDLEVMRQTLNIADTGHYALATIHANSSDQAIERMINFYDFAERRQVLLNLSFNVRAILSQRLIRKKGGGRTLAMEIMLNKGDIPALIREGRTVEIKQVMADSEHLGMQTFDQHLFRLWKDDVIDDIVAIAESDDKEAMEKRMYA